MSFIHLIINVYTLFKHYKDAARAKQLRNKFEKWESSKDAQDQARQILIHDENGETLETATNLKARFEALQMEESTPPPVRQKKFVPKRFKVRNFALLKDRILYCHVNNCKLFDKHFFLFFSENTSSDETHYQSFFYSFLFILR